MRAYSLKIATTDDFDGVIECISNAQNELLYKLPFSPDRTRQVLLDVLKQGTIICGMNEHKQIVGVFIALKTLTATSLEPIASEMLWYVHPAYRKTRLALELFGAFEYWAETVAKVGVMIMGNMTNAHSERTHRLYLRHGYQLSEQTYFKRIN